MLMVPPLCRSCDQQARLLPLVSHDSRVDYYCCDTCGTVMACEKNSSTVIHVAALLCRLCAAEGWVCEQHPAQPWPHPGCQSPRAPCPVCRTSE